MTKIITCAAFISIYAASVFAFSADTVAKLPQPEVNADSWIMIEIWPEVSDITLAAYFLDTSYRKNKGLCEATQRVFDREAAYQTKETGRALSSYRICLSVVDARDQGYFREP